MNVNFSTNPYNRQRLLQVDNARIIWPNFSGRKEKYNRNGNREFNLVIANQEIADAMVNDKNEYGVGWNVKVRPPRDEDDSPLLFMKVSVKFNSRGPAVYLKTGKKTNRLNENTIGMLDDIDIASVDLDIRPYDGRMDDGTPFRSAYLQSIWVTQNVDRFAARYAEEEFPADDPEDGEAPF